MSDLTPKPPATDPRLSAPLSAQDAETLHRFAEEIGAGGCMPAWMRDKIDVARPTAPRQEPPQEIPQWANLGFQLQLDEALRQKTHLNSAGRIKLIERIISIIARHAPPPAAPVEAQGGELRDGWRLVLEWATAASGFGMPSDPHARLEEIGKIACAALSRPVAPVGEPTPQSSASLGEGKNDDYWRGYLARQDEMLSPQPEPKNPTLWRYLQNAHEKQITFHTIGVNRMPDGGFHIYIHPQSVSGDTQDFLIWPDPFNWQDMIVNRLDSPTPNVEGFKKAFAAAMRSDKGKEAAPYQFPTPNCRGDGSLTSDDA